MSDLGQLFSSYAQEAFRLEILPYYKVSGEWDNFQHYLQTGEALQDTALQDYLSGVQNKIDSGAKHIRLRVFDTPINDYQIFETKIGYIPSSKLGSAIFFLPRHSFEEILLANPQFKTVRDFWLFDNQDIAFMNYNHENEWTGFEIGTNNDVQNCLNFKNQLLNNALTLEKFLEQNLINKD